MVDLAMSAADATRVVLIDESAHGISLFAPF